MRHVCIRGMISLVWLIAAVVSGISGNLEITAFYCFLGGVFLYSAYSIWKKEKGIKGEK
ncbi:MAG: hypothetical protein HFJ10_04475 [Lachnospiraceae bacterium]|nr:hypothetical protein [Lachnospiraceae bacterium]